ncbi:MAG TPA: hypothetical protein VM821_04760 [Abditibacteriaceae bacterium]|jgi:hypothetical protein|nr:hypothetical protein [Abditibacteriaceae bacterium]
MNENLSRTPDYTLPAENTFRGWLSQLDRLLRGEATKLSSLRRGVIDVSPEGMSLIILALGALYGLCMGSYALFQTSGPSWPQMLATVGKVPLLFLLTIIVTFPSLYVFNALVGSRLTLSAVLRLIIATVAVMLAILASFGPIVAFFSVSTTSYPFMLLLNVVIFALSGFLGLKFLLGTLHRLTLVQNETVEEQAGPDVVRASAAASAATASQIAPVIPAWNAPVAQSQAELEGALDEMDKHLLSRKVTTVFYLWIFVFGLVGSQMSWVLRPFLGHPDRPFTLFAGRESNFFEAVWNLIWHL